MSEPSTADVMARAIWYLARHERMTDVEIANYTGCDVLRVGRLRQLGQWLRDEERADKWRRKSNGVVRPTR